MIKLLKGNTPLIIVVSVVVALAVWQVNTWTRVNPKKKKIAKQEQLIQVKTDSLELADNLQKSLRRNLSDARFILDSLQANKTGDSLNFVSRTKQLQRLVRSQSDIIKNLEKGVRVDRIEIRYNWNRKKILDSTYVEGWEWGI